jgi:queuine tRNA-ribosyltransferase
VTRPPSRTSREPLAEGCPCLACREHTRAYLHYLARARELTAVRLLTLHNLTFMALLMDGLRGAIRAGRYTGYARDVLAGRAPYPAP